MFKIFAQRGRGRLHIWAVVLITILLVITNIFTKNNVAFSLGHDNQFSFDMKQEHKYASEIPVLMYHHLLKESENRYFKNNGCTISLREFEQQMKILYDNGFKTVSLSDLKLFLHKKKKFPVKSVLITFDDGYLSNYQYAYPVLKKYHFKAAVFIITSNINQSPQPFHPDKLTRLSWEEMRSSSDVFEFASHTHALHEMEQNQAYLISKSEEEIINDLKHSRQLLNNTPFFAYPYGRYNEKTIEYLKECGYELAFTTKEGYASPETNPYEINRYPIYPSTPIEKFMKIIKLGQ